MLNMQNMIVSGGRARREGRIKARKEENRRRMKKMKRIAECLREDNSGECRMHKMEMKMER